MLTHPPAFHFLAGLGSGVFSAVLLQPADLLKTRVQQAHAPSLAATVRAITAGPAPLRQLWRGTLPSAVRTGLGSALYFSSLNALRSRLAALSPTSPASSSSSALPRLSSAANLAAGAAARAAVGFALMPVTVVKVRYESSLYGYRSLGQAAAHVLHDAGPRGFFAGAGATAARDAPYAGLYVLFYEQAKHSLAALLLLPPAAGTAAADGGGGMADGRTAAAVNFASGVLAAGVATAVTNPFDAVKTRLQLEPRRYGNMVRAARKMVADEGWRCLADGLGLRMGRKAMSSALAWTVYEEAIRRAERRLTVGEGIA